MGNNGSSMRTKVCRAPNGDLYYTRQRERSPKDPKVFSVIVDGRKRKFYKDDDGAIWFRDGKCWYPYEHREKTSRVRERPQSLYVDAIRSSSPDSFARSSDSYSRSSDSYSRASDSYTRSTFARSSYDRASSVEPHRRSYYVEKVSQSCYGDDLVRPCSSDGYSRGSFERVRTPPAEIYRRSLYSDPSSDSYIRRFEDDKVSVRIINVEP